ncbi:MULTISPECIES: DUF5990 family protein [Sphingopyxis]|jgi:hypothetical protein|uniref:Uncharacterized protein n=1 Tax=Sphingopyxis macrogoltabida TaxID=33050 RepID=A0A0N9UUX6_SPHMC|nr:MULTISPECIES: DUF5990 family protein [Sphingopyxis]ALH79257.1 hypothetical protein AN936_02370 [Sphingopyxis macrogoltabida]
MTRANQSAIPFRIVIEQPVVGVLHSLQDKRNHPLDPKSSAAGEPLTFDFIIRVGPGPKFFGDLVRREGPERRFVYICVGQMAGDPSSPWSRRMKIDIHDIEQRLLDEAPVGSGRIEISIIGTGKDGTPACATVQPMRRRMA